MYQVEGLREAGEAAEGTQGSRPKQEEGRIQAEGGSHKVGLKGHSSHFSRNQTGTKNS